MGHRDFVGASGVVYRYLSVESDQGVPLGAGNFLYAREADGCPTVVYAGEAERLVSAIRAGWDDAVSTHGATHLFARRNVGFATRAAEQADLVKGYAPVMNGPVEETEPSASLNP